MTNQSKTIIFSVFVVIVLVLAFTALRMVTDNPGRVVENFYSQWISSSNPLSDGVYKNNKYLSDNLINVIAQTAATSAENAAATDPVLCSLEKPSSYQVNWKERNDDVATYVVTERWNAGNSIETVVNLKRFGVLWKINEIVCGAPVGGAPTINENADIESKVAAYIRENISSLSPEKEVLGGKYYVTQLAFIGDNKEAVSYEDGHIAQSATFTYSITEAGDVVINSFVLDNPTPKAPQDNLNVETQPQTNN